MHFLARGWHFLLGFSGGRRVSHRSAINVLVKEQIPVSTRDDVKVMARPATPAPTLKDGGLLEFSLTVGAGAEGVVTYGYEVEYPTEIQLGWME